MSILLIISALVQKQAFCHKKKVDSRVRGATDNNVNIGGRNARAGGQNRSVTGSRNAFVAGTGLSACILSTIQCAARAEPMPTKAPTSTSEG